MFEPENEIERLLVRAASDPSARAAFTRALMDAQIFLVLVPDGPVEQQADGSVKVPEGTKLTLPSASRGAVKLLPFFSSPTRARDLVQGRVHRGARQDPRTVRPLCRRAVRAQSGIGLRQGVHLRRGEAPAVRSFRRRPGDGSDPEAGAGAAVASGKSPDQADRGVGARARRAQIGARRLADAGDARGPERARAGCSASTIWGAGRTCRPRSAVRSPEVSCSIASSMRCRSITARSRSTCVPEFPSSPPRAASSIRSSRPDHHVQTQSSHFRRAVPGRRADLQGPRRRGRLPAQSRQGQGQARRDHRQLRRARDPLGDQGDRQDHREGDEAEGDRPRRHRRRQCRDSRRRPPRASS